MANTTIAIRSSGIASNTPSLGVIANGELSINYADGILYYKTSSNTLGSIRTTQPAGLTTEIQFNDAGSFGSDSGLTYNKTTDTITVVGGIVAGGINLTPTLASAYDKANAANVLAQAAFNTANTANTSDYTNVLVSAGTYGNASSIPSITVAANGRITTITTESFTAASIGDALALSIALG
jgi:hypothetical protein